MPPQPDTLERETIYSLLSDRVRACLLRCLSVADRVTTSEAAKRIAKWERKRGATSREIGRNDVALELIHNHLPRLAQYDVVDYDRSSDEIAPGPNFDDVEPFVADLESPIDPR